MSAKIIAFPTKQKVYVSNNTVAVANSNIRYHRIKGVDVKEPTCREEYLYVCKTLLEPYDYQDVLCGILDREHYDDLEHQYKKVVDSYYDFPE